MLGLTFKPNTDDMRDAPALDIVPALQARAPRCRPSIRRATRRASCCADVDFKDGPYEAAEGADALVIITEWDQFRALDLDRIKLLMKQPVMIDLRNIYKPERHARPRLRLYERRADRASQGASGPRSPTWLIRTRSSAIQTAPAQKAMPSTATKARQATELKPRCIPGRAAPPYARLRRMYPSPVRCPAPVERRGCSDTDRKR